MASLFHLPVEIPQITYLKCCCEYSINEDVFMGVQSSVHHCVSTASDSYLHVTVSITALTPVHSPVQLPPKVDSCCSSQSVALEM